MDNKIVYANLGANCGERSMYVRSTDIEQKNWESLLMSFPDEALYYMTKGKKIVIIDKSGNKGKVQHIFCKAFQDFLRRIKYEDIKFPEIKDHTALALQAYRKNKSIHRKYEFFKYRLKTLMVVGRTIRMNKEPSIWT